ncbi:TRAP transporter TatT component family protein [Candidatus Neomarinimicrobiota bacterium]
MKAKRFEHIASVIPLMLFLAIGCAGPSAAHRPTAVHTGYAYAFLSRPADRVQEKNLQRARKMRGKAREHYVRAYEAGMGELEARHPGFGEALMKNPGEAITVTTMEDIDLLYWTAAALGSAIGLSKDKPEMLIRLAQLNTLAHRVVVLDSTYSNGSGYELMMIIEAGRPAMMGGSVALAKHYYEQSLTISQGKSAGAFVSYGESICVQEQDRETFIAMMERALAVKGGGIMNRMAKRRAKWLLTKIDDLFL